MSNNKFGKRILLSLFLVSSLLIILASGVSAKTYISDCVGLQNMQNNISESYVLINNIDCSDTINWNSGAGFIPVGTGNTLGTGFYGNFNGQGYNISHLYVKKGATFLCGLFGGIVSSNTYNPHVVIKDVGIINASINGGSFYIGGLAGFVRVTNSNVTISQVFVINSNINSTGYGTGGLIGELYDSSTASLGVAIINKSYVANTNVLSTHATGRIGGLIGGLQTSTNAFSKIFVYDSYATGGNITGVINTGGFVGRSTVTSPGLLNISNSYATGNVNSTGSSTAASGGFGGYFSGGAYLYNSFAVGNIEGSYPSSPYVGNILGIQGAGSTNSWFYDSSICLNRESGGCNNVGAGSYSSISSFYNSSNAPMSSWDFTGTYSTGSSFPTLTLGGYTNDQPIPPLITLNNPINLSSYNIGINNTITFNFTPIIGDGAIINCSLWGNFSGMWTLNQSNSTTLTNNTAYTFSAITISEGSYIWNTQCIDSYGTSVFASSNYSFTVQAGAPAFVPPNVTLIYPLNNTKSNQMTPTFSCNATGNSANISSINLYIWNSTGNLINNSIMSLSSYCYQEFANMSESCGALATPNSAYSINASTGWTAPLNTYDGNWGTSAQVTGGSGNWAGLFINYTIPLNINKSLSYWTFGTNNGRWNFTIPQSCWDRSNTTLMILGVSGYGTALYRTGGYCLNSSGVYQLFATDTSLTFYEEAMWWYTTSANTPNSVATKTINLPGSNNYTWNCLANDSNGQSAFASANYSLLLNNISPIVSLISPSNSTSSRNFTQSYSCNATDTTNLQNITFNLWNSANTLVYSNTTNPLTGTFNQTSWTYSVSSSDTYRWNCMALDDYGNTAYAPANRTVLLDQYPPSITLTLPLNNSINSWTVLLRSTVTDSIISVNSTWYEIRNGTISSPIIASGTMNNIGSNIYNATFATNATWPYDSTVYNYTNLTLVVYANDTLGNTINASTYWTLDNSNPGIQHINPTDIGLITNTSFNLNIYLTNFKLNYSQYNITNSSGVVIQTNQTNLSSATFFWTDLVNVPTGNYTLTTYVRDSQNNSRTKNTWFYVDKQAPTVTLISPTNNTQTNYPNQSFACSAIDNIAVANTTIYIWNSIGNLIYNVSANSSYLFPEEGTYNWNCLSYDIYGNSAFAPANYSLTLTYATPAVNLISPLNGLNSFNTTHTFQCNTTSLYDLRNITLQIWNSSNSLIIQNITNISSISNSSSWTNNLQVGEYKWNCLVYSQYDGPGTASSNYTLNISTDTTGPTITFFSQVPADLNLSNFLGPDGVNVTYNITDVSGLNPLSLTAYVKTNNTLDEINYYVNGTAYSGYINRDGFYGNSSSLFTWRWWDNQILPASYNYPERTMETTPHSSAPLSNNDEYLSVELLNVSNSKQYGFFEIMANRSTGALALRYYYCNSSYEFGVSNAPALNSNCVNFYSDTDGTYNHFHTNYSAHKIAPFPVNITTGKIGTVFVTPTSYFMIRGASNWNYYYITNTTRISATKTTNNNAASWANETYTVDSHLHQFGTNTSLWYYVCANDTLNNSACSTPREDRFELAGLPPTSPEVYSPTNTTYSNSIPINYTESVSPNAYAISFYNISLYNTDYSFNMTIQSNNSNNLSYLWNSTNISAADYIIQVTACDILAQCSSGYSEQFTITHGVGPTAPSIVSVTAPATTTLNSGTTKTIYAQFNASDENGASDINDTTAQITVFKSGETSRTSSGCSLLSSGTTWKAFNCTITMQFYDGAGSWNVNASISDNLFSAYNSTETFNVNNLDSITLIQNNINFGSSAPGTYNISGTPQVINNTGNQNYINLTLKAYSLSLGSGSAIMEAPQFCANSISSPIGCNFLVNNTAVSIGSGLTLSKGINSYNTSYHYANIPIGKAAGIYTATQNWIYEAS